ncbi:MAG: asparagine synthase-related protein [Haloferacaceae archaeon]
MPGLSVIDGRGSLPPDAVDAAFDAVRFDDDYARETLYDGDEVLVGWTGYPAYPGDRLKTDRWHLFLDGALYDRSLDDDGERVADWLAAGDDDELASWLRSRDGAFVLVAVDRATEETHVLTDAFARLPTYRASIRGADVVSRELALVGTLARETGTDRPVDRLGVAQTLLFGYRLGDRTLYKGVSHLPPAARVRLGGARERVFRYDFGTRTRADRSVRENARRLARQFAVACENRARGGPVVVSLSGGLDSRAAAAGYATLDVPTRAATFDPITSDASGELRVAERVARAVGLPWKRYRVTSRAEHEAWLVETMQGMNSVGMAPVVDFLDALVDDHGRGVTLVTGDGGDKALPDLTPPRSFGDLDALVDHLVAAHAVMTPADAAAAAGVDEDALVASVAERIRSYPESAPGDRYAHFAVRERAVNWLNHGEDRNRYFCWSASPFYAAPFFLDAMNCPPEQKRRGRLYRAFLRQLSPGIERIEHADFGASPDSVEYALKRFVYEQSGRYPRLKEALLGTVRSRAPSEETVRRLRTTLATDERVTDVLSADAVGRALDAERVPDIAAYDLLTIAAVAGRSAPLVPTTETGT